MIAVIVLAILIIIIYLAASYKSPATRARGMTTTIQNKETNQYKCSSEPGKVSLWTYDMGPEYLYIECTPDGSAKSYELYASKVSNFNVVSESIFVYTSPQPAFHIKLSTLCGGSYYFKFRAKNDCGYGQDSDQFQLFIPLSAVFKICSDQNPQICLNGQIDPGAVRTTGEYDCSQGGCNWTYDNNQIKLFPYNNVCVYQNGNYLDTRTCVNDDDEYFSVNFATKSITNTFSGDSLKAPQDMFNNVVSGLVTLDSDDSSSAFNWMIRCPTL
jgi:hypothetical protein